MTGITKSKAKNSLEMNVEMVDSHISLVVWWFSDSSETWMLKESEKASAIAMVNMPPKTALFECVPEYRPTINPMVVIIAEVNPKLRPIFSECFIIQLSPFILSMVVGLPSYDGKGTIDLFEEDQSHHLMGEGHS